MCKLLILVLLALVNQVISDDNSSNVTTPTGTIIGYYKTSFGGRKYEVYEGVPYAKPPVGDLRFEEAIPITISGTIHATSKKPTCIQYIEVAPDENGQQVVENRVDGDDDCLYLNVNVPVLKNKSKMLPVIFFIHGGSYQHGSGTPFATDNKFLMDKDVIFVSINYRLGIQGFLSTEDEVLPGNLGLKDQSLALRWTSENIGYFGGDPGKITLVGFSVGSTSVQYHYLSPLSRGLFHAGIALSGSVFYALGREGSAAEKAKKLGALFNCPTENSRQMIDCLKKVPAKTLAAATKEFQYWQYAPDAPFAPVVEKHGNRPFINKIATEILRAKEVYNVPIIFGVVKDDGCAPGAEYAPHDNILGQLNEQWVSIAPHLLTYNYTLPKEMHEKVALAARIRYFGDKSIDKSMASQLIQLLTDKLYFYNIEAAVRLHAQAVERPVYFYFYSYRATCSCSEEMSHNTNDYGVCHGDDLFLLFDSMCKSSRAKTNIDLDMTNTIADLWMTVAHDGVPDPKMKWEPVSKSGSLVKYLHIRGPGDYSMESNSDFGQKNFWSKYFPNM